MGFFNFMIGKCYEGSNVVLYKNKFSIFPF